MMTYNSADQIKIVWDVDDVLSLDTTLTKEQCREVLRLAKKYHDATQGINWDVIEAHISTVKGTYYQRHYK